MSTNDNNDSDPDKKDESFEKRLAAAQKKSMDHVPEQTTSEENRATGMRAGSEFIASVFGGCVVGYGLGYLTNNIPLFLISFMFIGFVWGIYRAAKTSK